VAEEAEEQITHFNNLGTYSLRVSAMNFSSPKTNIDHP
jgi:hypothetical protein